MPSPAEIRDQDMMVEGIWGRHATFGSRFEVQAWGPIARPVIEQPAPKKKTRRIAPVAEKPKKPRTRRLSAVPPSPAPSKAAVQSTNDWYAQSGGQGDSLDLLDQ